MRKLLVLLLLAVFGLPLASPVFALGADAGVPACCRQDGRHHCERSRMANMDGLAADMEGQNSVLRVKAPQPRCPFCPQAPNLAHGDTARPSTADAIYAGLVSHPAVAPQVRSKWRIARERSRSKRGPPPGKLA